MPLFSIKNIQNGTDENIYLKIPVRFADGSVEEYRFKIRLYWKTETLK